MADNDGSLEGQVADTATAVPFSNADASKIKFAGDDNSGNGAGDNDDDGEDPLKGLNGKGGNDDGAGSQDGDGDEGNGGEGAGSDESGFEPRTFKTLDEYEGSVNSIVEKITGGNIKSIHQVKSVFEDNIRLKQELETKGKEIPFPNEKAKILYDYANKATNFETQAMGQYLHVLSLGDVNKLDDKTAQFEAYHLSRPDLTREKAQRLFEAEYNEKYTDLEDNLLQQDRHELATREAKAKLGQMVENFSKAPEDSTIDPKVTEAIHKEINDAFDEFAGIKIPFGEKDEDALSLNLDSEEASEFKQVLTEPIRLIEKIIEGCTDEKGKLNVQAYYSEMYALFAGKKIAEEAFKHGQTLGQVGLIKDRRNVQNRGAGTGSNARAPKPTFEEALAAAITSRN